MYIERINPNHVGILWGRRHKKFNKGTHYVKAGMVYFSWIPIVMGLSVLGWFDVALNFFYRGIVNIGLLGIVTGLTVSFVYYKLLLWISKFKERPIWKNTSVS